MIAQAKHQAVRTLAGTCFHLLVVIACLLIGIAGIILPVIPGLLFLLMAAMAAARLAPGIETWLRRNALVGQYLDHTEGFFRLSMADKGKFLGWITLRMCVDTIVVTLVLIRKGLKALYA